MILLQARNLSVSFHSPSGTVEAVRNVSFSIAQGEMFALVGESGSGKSLTALSVMQLLPANARCSGNMEFEGQELIGAPGETLRRLRGGRIGMVFQEPMMALNPLHAIGRQIEEMWQGASERSERTLSLHALLSQVGLTHLQDRLNAYPHELSGGERQRVMIAMAIANRPALLIADEPTTAVDVTVQAKILALIKDLQKTLRMGILFITHDLTLVRRLADRVAVMRQGEIVETGTVAEVFSTPRHPYTRQLIASEPSGEALPLSRSAAALMECRDLKVYFPVKKGLLQRTHGYVKAVDGVSLSIPEGATLGVVGESGSGKTTLAFALLKLIRSQGRIVYMGQAIDALRNTAMRSLRRELQVVFQDPYGSLNPRMTIRQIIEEGLRVHERNLDFEARGLRVDSVLIDVGLSPDMKERYPHEFSGGQRQRISIARAMVLKPRFVVLDEPTSALDLTVQAQIVALLKELQQKHGVTLLFISHDLRVVRAIAHRVIVMRRGVIVEEAQTQALFSAPRHEYTKALIDAAFFAGG